MWIKRLHGQASENDQNYIIYRLADVLLMKAEALIMQGHNEEAADLIDRTRERAGLGETTLSDDRMVMLETLLVERQKEFFGEGKNWFDLLRIGLRSEQLNDTQYKTLFVEQAFKGSGCFSTVVRTCYFSKLGLLVFTLFRG